MVPDTSRTRVLRILVIGAGPASVAMHLPVLARLQARGDITLTAVCDLQRERAAAARQQFGFQEDTGDAIAALSRADIDAVYIFGSAQLHYTYGLEALLRGKHLFVEKPIAPSYAQACDIARTAHSQGLVAVGGHNRRFYRTLAAVRARAGSVGWRYAEAVFHKPEFGKSVPFGAQSWLSANGIHALDALVFLMGGLPEYITALAGDEAGCGPNAFSALMRWSDGAQGVFLCNNNAGARREQYVLHGPGETCTVTDTELSIERDGVVTKTPVVSIGDGVDAEHEAFLRAVRDGIEPPHAVAALAPSLLLAELIEAGFNGPVPRPQSGVVAATRAHEAATGSILVVQPTQMQSAIAPLLANFRMVSLEDVRDSPHERTDIVGAILGPGAPPLSPAVLNKMPRLAIVGVAALSLVRYAPEMLLARGITVVNASTAYAQSVAEFALGLAILGRRRAFVSHDIMRGGGWGTHPQARGLRALAQRTGRKWRPAIAASGLEPFARRMWKATNQASAASTSRPIEARELRGATVGLIGWSANAQAFSERLLQAGACVSVYSEHAQADEIERAGARQVSLGEALAADIVSLHRGLTQRTLHCLGEAELAKLRPGSVLINIARGALIEPSALLARLRVGDIFACLDTFEDEPLAASDPLRTLSNVFLTSHIAGGSSDMRAAAAEEVVGKVIRFLWGDAVPSVSTERLRTMT